MQSLKDAFTPNKSISREFEMFIIISLLVLVFGWWYMRPIAMMPKLVPVLKAYRTIWNQGIVVEVFRSFMVNLKALILTAIISLGLSYLTVLPIIRPIAELVAKFRFLGMAGLTLPFTLVFGGGEHLKIAILTFGMTTYFVTAMADEVASIPREKFDHARSLRYGEWRAVWEVVILGKMDRAFEVFRQIAGYSWAMVTLVEGIVMSGGGIGMVLILRTKQYDRLPEVAAIIFLLVGVGVLFDNGLRKAANSACEWAYLTLERR